jgi:hypothetical protein
MQNRATLRNALRKRNYELPSVSNDMQSSETLRNSLGLNYKSAALNQLSYAGISHTKAVFSELIKSSYDPFRAPRCKRDQNFTVFFYGHEKWFRTPGGRGRLLQHGQTSKLVTVLGNFSAKGDLCRRRRDAKPPQDVMAESDEGAESDAALEAE